MLRVLKNAAELDSKYRPRTKQCCGAGAKLFLAGAEAKLVKFFTFYSLLIKLFEAIDA